MPELPEVETVRRGLQPVLEGARLSDVHLNRPNLRYPFPDRFAERLNDATVLRLERRAKYLLFHLDTQDIWVTHLGMTGRFQITGANAISLDASYYHAQTPQDRHRHVRLLSHTDNGTVHIDFYDPRRFGFMLLLRPDELYAQNWWRELGTEPLSDALTPDHLYAAFSPRRQNLKALLMDQRLISGLGNIYVCEALYLSGLHPDRSGTSLTRDEATRLTQAIKDVLEAAVKAGGSSISDFSGASGELGYFQHNFTVYGREHQPCQTSGCTGIITRKVHSGRSTFFCPVCQS
ncbi:bifunctional DNA-formamidopyrimidine glycosylase/DNA-(apurinic or apyrimidinic site) lyase [Asticcacaulis tiandongensis]|uniref:bifunctional DNA-formamidopyrimidine glycosylase/DNA-(apurinic or apyrimidinic site) lyase n=1 Tax=Asticcacaulis tiandongensis TaxID=2565365 RepID=UPI00112C2889|nr:bifunctional DNA-formamidopyrimidine glycosylase/DNA-(apurinic or apyrimidinic site) lyase [Asticcacaulis tiandongensis]